MIISKKSNSQLLIFSFLIICSVLLFSNCSGINLTSNCGKNHNITFAVLPFLNDDYRCHINIESKLENMCYNIINGELLINDYSNSHNKKLEDISITEFTQFAKTRGVTKLIFGNVTVVWQEGKRTPNSVIQAHTNNTHEGTTNERRPKSTEEDMYYLITGNYANLTCYSIDTETLEKTPIFTNYKVKKISQGSPSSLNFSK